MFENLETNAIAKESELFQDYPEFMYLQTLDIATFQELRETIGDDIIFSDLITIYLNSAENLIGSIQSAFTEQDANKFALASHSLKSTSASIGATRLSLISKYLEKIGRTGEITISSEFLDFLNNEYNEVIKAIKVCILEFISQ
ncbi:Hpt domain-containing protein [Pseudanabaena galeata UHCC 0370]|uniref:Hpt domain-containing protein n=1 Tax=Pseudanabaena galeata UHCC 0370 TaxID=3110310 RepID=A0ABU5TF74_9CYAN|nr:Hpt domain-containing protein [Pseudanabaena galeata]MEA5476932.1 Hpt domain-containing protein [Pseudanabaena galeata UHCC 0370]